METKDVYTVEIKVDGVVTKPGALELWIQAEGGEISTWNIY